MSWNAFKRHTIRYVSLIIIMSLLLGIMIFLVWASSKEEDIRNNNINLAVSVIFFIGGYAVSALVSGERSITKNTEYISEISYLVLAKITIKIWIIFFTLRIILMSPILSLDNLVIDGELKQATADKISTIYGGSMGIVLIIVLCWFAYGYGYKYKNITVKEIMICLFIGGMSMSLFFTILGIANISVFEIIDNMEIEIFEHNSYFYFLKNYTLIFLIYLLFNVFLTSLFVLFYYLGGGYSLKSINQSSH